MNSIKWITIFTATAVLSAGCGVKGRPLPPLDPVEFSKSQNEEMSQDKEKLRSESEEEKAQNFLAPKKKKKGSKPDAPEDKK